MSATRRATTAAARAQCGGDPAARPDRERQLRRRLAGGAAQIVIDEATFILPLEGVIDIEAERRASPRQPRRQRRNAIRSPRGSPIPASSSAPSRRRWRRRGPIMPRRRPTPRNIARRWRGSADGNAPGAARPDFRARSRPTLLAFALPTLGSSILQSLNGSINAIWVGRFLGEGALAATSNANMIMFLLMAFVFGFGMAATVLVGQAFGAGDVDAGAAGDRHRDRRLRAGRGRRSALLGWIAAPALLELLGTPADADAAGARLFAGDLPRHAADPAHHRARSWRCAGLAMR